MSSKYLNAQIIYLDSHNRTSGTHDDFDIPVDIKADAEVDSVAVLRATIKKSYYLVSAGANTFTLKEGSNTATITVPPGNYSASSFKKILQDLLNLMSPSLPQWVYTVSLPNPLTQASTGKFTYSCAGGNPQFIIGNFLFEQLGFDSNQTVSFTGWSAPSTPSTLVSANVLNFQLKDVLRIHSNMISDSKDNILQEVSALASDFSALKYECIDVEANTKPLRNVSNSYHFSVLDEDYNKVSLSLNILITLIVYKKNDLTDRTNQMLIDYIRYKYLKEK